jgi:hypothetical protein
LCKTHYFKRFNEQGNYLGGENFAQKSTRGNTTFTPPAAPSSTPTPSAASSAAAPPPTPEETERRKSIQERMKAFGGGAGNQVKCAVCDKTVYPNDPQIALDGVNYHKECAKCSDCKCQITLANFCKFETTLFCKTHYFKRFSEEGSYLGGDKYAQKSGVARAAAAPVSEASVPSEAAGSEAVVSEATVEAEAPTPVVNEAAVEDSQASPDVAEPSPTEEQASAPEPASTPEAASNPEVPEEPTQADAIEEPKAVAEEVTPTTVTEGEGV